MFHPDSTCFINVSSLFHHCFITVSPLFNQWERAFMGHVRGAVYIFAYVVYATSFPVYRACIGVKRMQLVNICLPT